MVGGHFSFWFASRLPYLPLVSTFEIFVRFWRLSRGWGGHPTPGAAQAPVTPEVLQPLVS